ncbi:hypothetical protein [Tardiphaga sp. 709]|uniref:hypothetical protein n=1 Tax=Tardiphaga sp. 709 TaxID=3076039 RepID=UPI0028EBA91A|nr:hypothetical protein [Tardiphaga sp. 709]WNV09343.1 hypothetical protein RSO67_28425 [Tardiphaga sp. 709]
MVRKPMARPARKPARAAVVSTEETPAFVLPDAIDDAPADNMTSDDRAKPGSRGPLVERVTKVIERELDLIENIVGRIGGDEALRTESERRARTLAVLARTLIELKKARVDDEQGSAEDDDRPRDLDELRQRLSERLAKRLRGGAQLSAGGADTRRDGIPE